MAASCNLRSPLAMFVTFAAIVAGLAGTASADEKPDLLVLMHATGTIESYDPENGKHVGTYLRGLPPSNSILFDSHGRLLISTGLPGEVGTVLRYDPKNRKMETFLNVPEGYGGHLFRATGMAWHEGDLLVASQGDGKIKRYDGKSGEWKADVAHASTGGITQIAVHEGRLYLTDYPGKSIRIAAQKLDGSEAAVWAEQGEHSPWGLVIDARGRAYSSTTGNRILRTEGKETVEWAGAGGGIATPVGLALGPTGELFAANLQGKVSVWKTDRPQLGPPIRVIGGEEMKSPISMAFTSSPREKEFVHVAPSRSLAETPEKLAFFESKVRPLLLARCIECHGDKKTKGGLRLDRRAAWMKGGDSGPAIIPGKPDESLLIKAVRYQDKDFQMPPKMALPASEVEILVEWVRQGAIDPRREADSAVSVSTAEWDATFQKRLEWWSLKPLRPVPVPSAFAGPWGRDPVDRFIKAGLDGAKLNPAAPADPEVLLRRLSFVLTGLPPTASLRERFLKLLQEDEPKAYEKLVDELLASPHFGERFARHWMDVVRYTDTYGYEWDNPAKGSHEYRDYLIRAFNGDLPYDKFLREQLAGDLLSTPRLDSALGINESLIGPMFYHLGEHRHGSSLAFNGVHQEMVNNKIDAFSKTFLATTVACARCHDHKLEAVSQRDYYALAAVFMTPRWTSRVVDAPGKNDVAIKQLQTIRDALRKEMAATWRQAVEKPDAWAAAGWLKRVRPKDAKAPTPGEIDYPLVRLMQPTGDVATTWASLATEWRTARADREKHNKAFANLGDFAKPAMPTGWVTEGDGFRFGCVDDGTPLVALEGDGVFARLLPLGYHSHALSSKFPGAVRMPPDAQVPGRFVSLNLAGGQFGGFLETHENAFQGEEVTFLNQTQPGWRTFADKALTNGVSRVTYTFATSSLNPNFPPRTGIAPGLPNNDFGYDKRSWISMTGIVAHDVGGTPLDTLDAFQGLYDGTAPKTQLEAQQRLSGWMTQAATRWCDGKTKPGDQAILDWLLTNKLLPNTAPPKSKLDELVREYRRVEQEISFPRTVNSMDERETTKSGYPLNVRGNVDVLGEMVRPDFLRMFAGRNDVAKSSGSGRLELANSLLQPDHPLTARVYVNRIWHWVMGSGLVATPDDFGRLGEKPTHPELLDYMATEFMREGWSSKKLIRRLVLSQTFRQAGVVSEDARMRDPGNRLRHHYPTRRLEAEAIRDSVLAVSGRLDGQLFGRPIFPPRLAEDGAKRLFAGPLDGNGRRSIYLQMSIMEPPKFLVGFNLPDLRLSTGRRDATNVPAQSLILLNDPFVHAMARHWGQQLVKAPHASPEERVRAMFVAAFGRSPTEAELKRWTAAVRDFGSPGRADLMKDETAWSQLGHAVFNTKEFINYR